ncbi:MAG: hypothetical protein RRZ24_01510 [Clostridia bacterium]
MNISTMRPCKPVITVEKYNHADGKSLCKLCATSKGIIVEKYTQTEGAEKLQSKGNLSRCKMRLAAGVNDCEKGPRILNRELTLAGV